MITGWLLKIVIVIVLLGGALIEVGSPIITRAQVDGAAHDAADDAAADYLQRHDVDAARAVAQADADKEHATIEVFEVDEPTGTVKVKLFRQSRSFLLKKFSQTRKFTEIRVTATSTGPGK